MKAKSKKWMGFLILGAMLICLYGGLVQAQTTTGQEDWVYIYDNPNADRSDDFNDVQKSPYDGYIYCTGRAFRNTSYYRLCLTKLDPATGDTVWHRRFDPSEGAGTDLYGEGYELDFDGAGNIYVAGFARPYSGNCNFTIVKFTPDGNLTHYDMYDRSGRPDRAYSVDIGPDNMVYVAGYTEDSDGATEFVVRKYDTTLTYKRMYWYDYSGIEMNAYRVRVDNNLNVWACGNHKAISTLGLKFTVLKLNTNLIEQARYQTGSNTSGADRQAAYDLCLPWGGGGGVYAVGCVYSSTTNKNFKVVKLDDNCNEEWSKTIANSGEEKALRVVSGPVSATYVAGYIRDPSGQNTNYTVVCYSGFIEAWRYVANGTSNSDDKALDIALNASGSYCYAAGYLKNTGQDTDFYVTKHIATDSLPLWEYTYDGPATEHDVARSIDVATDGNLYIAGCIEKDTNYYEAGAMSLPQNFPPTVPTLISPADSTFLSDTVGVTFVWNASTDFETSTQKYILFYDTDAGFATPESLTPTDTTTSTTLNDAEYYWKVKAQDTQGQQSKFSGVWSFRFDLTPPNTPVLYSPIAGAYVLDTSVTFDWGVVTFKETPSPVRYVIQIDTADVFLSPIVDDTSAVDSITLNLPGNDRYYWRVKAYDLALNESDYATAESFRLDMSPSLIESTTVWADTGFTGPFAVYSKVTDLFGVDSVVLMYCKPMEHPSWFSREMLEGSSDNIYFEEIPGVTMANDTVKYYIYAKDNAGRLSTDPPGAPEDYYWFIAGYDPGVTEFDNPPTVFSFGLKSNPAKGKALFNLALPEAADVTLRIYDVIGRLIDNLITGRKPAGYYEIPWTSGANAGVYFYSFESPWKIENGKLVLVR